ncbi:MAG TPA: Fe-S-containing hydro-lyase [Ruminococcaceae bacterium]|nr:Fe-S-containing hydro-lyase [Oscillospiraceae bacterium]
MPDEKRISTPFSNEDVRNLHIGDRVLISGTIYTARDAAHKRLFELLQNGKKLPVDLNGQVVYYVGPAPAKPGHACGPAGPTSSYRMDAYTPALLDIGLKGMIGKGIRSQTVIESMKKNACVYFAAIGGAAALIAKSIQAVEPIAYAELGTEALQKMTVVDFPAVVVIDSEGKNLYETGRAAYCQS